MSTGLSFQDMILALQSFWAKQGCVIVQPYDMEMGAGTFHPQTLLKSLGPAPWRTAYVQPCRRPTDGRYGENPNRVQHYYQFQVLLKPSPDNVQDLYLESLKHLGLDILGCDIRFVEDNWESPTLGASGLGWEVWCHGLEITQFTYFQQVGGLACHPVSAEITYGLERVACALQGVHSFFDLRWHDGDPPVTYGDVFLEHEKMFSAYHFQHTRPKDMIHQFQMHEEQAQKLLLEGLTVPAYDHCIKASHLFNMLEARGTMGVLERAHYIKRVRDLAKACCQRYAKELTCPSL